MSVLRRLALAWAVVLGSCAAPTAELHLAPFVSRHTAPGYQHAEALGGMLEYHREADDILWALKPLGWRQTFGDGRVRAGLLAGLGLYEYDPDRPRTYARLFPLWSYRDEVRADGVRDTDWSLLFWLIAGGSSSDGLEDYFWFFPFFGTGRDFLTYDEFSFFLFPLYLENHKEERHSRHWLWPIFGEVTGSETGWHVFPLYGETEVPGKYRRKYVLWPFWTQAENHLDRKHPQTAWMLWPFYGRTEQDDYVAQTILAPIFGWASRPSTDYSSWGIWPLIKFEEGGRQDDRKLSRVLPLWLRFENEQTEYTSVLWPFFWHRKDDFNGMTREGHYFVPLFMNVTAVREDGRRQRHLRIWPFTSYRLDQGRRELLRVLDLGIPVLLEPDNLSRSFGWIYEVWTAHARQAPEPIPVREKRAWFNLYHEVEAGGHERWSIPVVGGRWTEPDGTVHSSWLFGLIRHRSGPGGGMEVPAFPGPGWPDIHRLALEEAAVEETPAEELP
ncbi:MAG: hypothetical protein ACYTF3_06995 [Planctomycetota bacterium]|jgi:hypothetical protein